MNILIDGHMLGTGEGGNERYIKNLIDGLRKIESLNIKIFKASSFYNNDIVRLLYSLPKLSWTNQADIVHSTYISPWLKFGKSILTIHDFAFKRFPEFFSLREKIIFNLLLPFSLHQADAVIVPSNFSKKEAIFFYPQYKDKIFVTPEAADPVFKSVNKKEAKKYLFKKYKIKERFLLSLNSRNSKKNINRLIESFGNLINDFPKLKLVIVSGKYNISAANLKQKNLVVLDRVTDEELNYFYNACQVFIYYSLYEGFGLPILEALKCGALVVASDIEAHREITKNKLLYADPFNPQDLFAKIRLLLEQKNLAVNFRNKGHKIVSLYDWDKTAKETLRVYKFVLKK